MSIPVTELLAAIAADRPCGDDLEDTQLLASFDAYRLFGQTAPLSAETDWRGLRDHSLEALQASKDFRLLAHLAGAVLRTEGLDAFSKLLDVAAQWLTTWPAEVFPRVDDDAILRRNALNGFADRMAIVDGLRRAPIVAQRQLGSLSIRELEIVTGHATAAEGETQSFDANQLSALLGATSIEELNAITAYLDVAVRSLKSIEEAMRSQGGTQAAPEFVNLATPLARTLKFLKDHLATRAPAPADAAGNGTADQSVAAAGGVAVGGIRNRDDAARAMDTLADFFRDTEPSSPIPLLLARAKRLVGKDFLAALQELAPDGLDQARASAGVRDE